MSRLKKTNEDSSTDEPIQYQKGWVEFYKLKFRVTPDVLIPRPETELLVDEVLNTLRAQREVSRSSSSHLSSNNNQTIVILDIGTGAGNIAIALAKNLGCNPGGCIVKIIATDVSVKALKIAKQNAKLHGVQDKIEFIQSDLLSNVIPLKKGIHNKIDPRFPSKGTGPVVRGAAREDDNFIIVTNLPYIPSARIPYLDSSVKDFEPHVALDGGEDGFGLYRKLFIQIKEKGLNPNLLLGEIDYTHGELAKNEADKYFPNATVEVKTDLAHKQRILYIKSL